MCQVASPEKAEAHVPLNKARVLHVAVKMADEKGLTAVSMRKLADQLGAGAMSLYHYFPNKNALLDEMVNAIFARIEAPTTDEDWKTALRKRAISTRRALTRHPWALDVMESSTSPGMANMQLHNAVVACLREAGFPSPTPSTPTRSRTPTSTASRCRRRTSHSRHAKKQQQSAR